MNEIVFPYITIILSYLFHTLIMKRERQQKKRGGETIEREREKTQRGGRVRDREGERK